MNPVWWPINAAQQAALHSPAQLLLYGGQSGGGKSDFLCGDAMWEYQIPTLRGLVIRESLGEMNQLADRMQVMYEPLGARWSGRFKSWVFPAGGSIRMGYLAQDKHIGRYRGNPYSWLGVDESGLHGEKRIRQMVGWLASVDPRLHVRGRFASNPGGPGTEWQMSVFLRGRCPIHFPATYADDNREQTSVYPGFVYQGAKWASDDSPVYKTTSFIPASVYDNPLYGQDKVDSLMSQTASVREQLLKGCWCDGEGLYFGFMRPDMVAPYAAIEDQWWWNHFFSIDYGYGSSSAAAGRYSVRDDGRVFKTGEIIEKKMDSVTFAKKVRDTWLVPKMAGGQQPRYNCWIVDYANDQHQGTGKSNMELMQEVFAPFGIYPVMSAKDPMGNAQNLYNGLANGALVLTNACPKAYHSLSTRTVDERKAVKKVHGSPMDDVYDETAYAYNTWILQAEKPGRLKIADDIEALRKSGIDENSLGKHAWLMEQKLQAKERKDARGIQLGGPRIGSVNVKRD
jgi:hypothetical protein